MKIIILGAGQVGASVAENLVSEANDITLVDTSEEYLAALRERLEIRTVCGNGASPRVLREAGADDADPASMPTKHVAQCSIGGRGNCGRISSLRGGDPPAGRAA